MPGQKLIVAHQGDHSAARANTIEAFRAAIASGADMIELDVRRTADGVLVIHHDGTIGEQAIDVLDLDAVQALAGACGYRRPRLADVVAIAQGRIMLDVEIKETGIEDAVLATLVDGGVDVRDFVVTTFHRRALPHGRGLAPP